jgi:mRNA interferase RelE/StbE
MQYEFEKSFVRDFRKVKENALAKAILEAINTVSDASSIEEIRNAKKLSGFKSAYRIRVGDYRIGCRLTNKKIVFVAFAHRKDIYKKFP